MEQVYWWTTIPVPTLNYLNSTPVGRLYESKKGITLCIRVYAGAVDGSSDGDPGDSINFVPASPSSFVFPFVIFTPFNVF